MREINLTKGLLTKTDLSDQEFLDGFHWCIGAGDRYAVTSTRIDGKRKVVLMHRLLMGLEIGDKREVDHINGDTLDNRRANLRICTRRENTRNRRSSTTSSSQFTGVSWAKNMNKWAAYVKLDGKKKNLGHFKNEEDAARAYDQAAIEHHGQFARPNFV